MLGIEYEKRIWRSKFRRKISSKKMDLRKERLPAIRLKRRRPAGKEESRPLTLHGIPG